MGYGGYYGGNSVLIALVLLWIFFGLIVIAAVALSLIASYKYVKACGRDNPWLAIIPGASGYALARTVPVDDKGRIRVSFLNLDPSIFAFFWLLTSYVSIIPVIGSLACLFFSFVYFYKIYYYMFLRIDGVPKKVLAMVSVFIPFIWMVKVLLWKPEAGRAYFTDSDYTSEAELFC